MALNAAKKRQLIQQRKRWYELKPIPVQLKLVADQTRFTVVMAGRRCLEKGTLVATPTGPVAIELLKIGDEVLGYSADGTIEATVVAETHVNGVQEVIPLLSSGRKYLAATADHKLLACEERKIDKYIERSVAGLSKSYRVRRQYVFDHINGGKQVKNTYSLGAMLGDGCCRNNKTTTGQYQKQLHISANSYEVPTKIAQEIGALVIPPRHNNYTWILSLLNPLEAIPFYKEWCSNRYAHEKLADWYEINTWDKESCLQFLSGVIDTDGSFYFKSTKQTEFVLNIGMQAKCVIDVCKAIIFKYFQEYCTIHEDSRGKYKNGSVWYMRTTSNLTAVRVYETLKPYLVKRVGFDLVRVKNRNILPDRIGFTKGKPYTIDTYDITVGNDTNLYVLHNGGIITHNSGKTERFKRKLIKCCMRNPDSLYFVAAPTYNQVKKIYWQDLKKMAFTSIANKSPSESNLIIYFNNGTELHLIGLDKSNRIEGIPWDGGGIDEAAYIKPEAWITSIYPALQTYDPSRAGRDKPWCWLLGKPKGYNYFTDLYNYAITANDPEWVGYHWKSSEVLDQVTLDAAKRVMSKKQYLEEFEASPQNTGNVIYEEYGTENYTDAVIETHEQICYFCDFNFTPMSHGYGVIREHHCDVATKKTIKALYCLGEIILSSAKGYQNAMVFVERFKEHKNKSVIIYGDRSGRNGEKHGHDSEYKLMEDVFNAAGWKVDRRVQNANPSIKDSQNAVNAKICNASGERALFVNPVTAEWIHKAFMTVQYKEMKGSSGSSFLEDDSDEYQHITTAVRYLCAYEWPISDGVVDVLNIRMWGESQEYEPGDDEYYNSEYI